MDIVGRADWGARHSAGFGSVPLPVSEVWLHHSVTPAPENDRDAEARAMRQLEAIGQQRFGGGVSYTYAIMPSGRIYVGTGVGRKGAHTKGRNSKAHAIVLVGDHTKVPPTHQQEQALVELLRHGKAHGWWDEAKLDGGHRQAPGASTSCPGDAAFGRIPAINRAAAGLPQESGPKAPPRPPASSVKPQPQPGTTGTSGPVWPGKVLELGDKGRDVRTVQQRFKDRGWRIVVDGDFGRATRDVVIAFQREKRIQQDGRVGRVTWTALWNTRVTR